MNKKYRHGQLKSIQRVECEVPKRGLFFSYINKVLCIYSLCKAHICHGYHGLYPWRKICHLEKFQISVKNLNNSWSFIEIYAVFVLNLCGENICGEKNDKQEIWFPTSDGVQHLLCILQLWRSQSSMSLICCLWSMDGLFYFPSHYKVVLKGLASNCKAKTTFAFHFSIINA